MWPNPQVAADLVTFTEEILNGKLQFLCSVSWFTRFGTNWDLGNFKKISEMLGITGKCLTGNTKLKFWQLHQKNKKNPFFKPFTKKLLHIISRIYLQYFIQKLWKLNTFANTLCHLEKLTISWRRPVHDWFLYDNGLRHERVNYN